MTDKAPIMMRVQLGGLRPASPAAQRAMDALDRSAPVRVEFKRTRGNQGRMALYWIVLAKAAPVVSELCDGPALDENMLHRVLKDRRGLVTATRLPSGDVVKNYDSISFAKMTEPERAEFVDWAFVTLAKWIGCTVDELTAREAATNEA